MGIGKNAMWILGFKMQMYHYTTQYTRTSYEGKVWMQLRKENETDGLAAEVPV